MTETYKITLNKNNGLEFGYIIYSIYENNSINISSLYITDVNEQGKGYGYGLLILFLCYIIKTKHDAYFIEKIHLDDCSDLALTKHSIYYKFGFRILDDNRTEVMRIDFLKPPSTKYMRRKQNLYEGETEPSIAYYKSIMEFYNNNILSSEKYKEIIYNMSKDIIDKKIYVNSYKFNNELSIFNIQHENLDVSKCLNIDEEINYNSHNTRSSQ